MYWLNIVLIVDWEHEHKKKKKSKSKLKFSIIWLTTWLCVYVNTRVHANKSHDLWFVENWLLIIIECKFHHLTWTKHAFGTLLAAFLRIDYFCESLFTVHGAHNWKKKRSLFLTETVHLAMVIFWIFAFSSAVSCKKISLLLPHQCPNFVIKILNFTSTTNCPNLCEVSCDASIWLFVWCVWVCNESHIGYLLGWTGFY